MKTLKLNLEEYLRLDYPVEIHSIPEELGGGFLACIPSLGRGMFSADGNTREEALANLDEVKKEMLKDLLERGKEIPLPPTPPEDEDYSGRLLVRVPKWLHAEIAARAQMNDCSINQYIGTALSKHVAGEECVKEASIIMNTIRAQVVAESEAWRNFYEVEPQHHEAAANEGSRSHHRITSKHFGLRFADAKAA